MVGKKSNSRRRIDLWIIWGKFKDSYRKQDKEALKYFLQENTGVYSKDIQLCAQVGHAVNTLYMFFFLYMCIC